MRPMTTEMLKKGYLLFPKALFEEQMNMKTGEKAADAFEAFVFVLTHVNYSTVTCNVRGHLFDCVRGESVLSLARWMEILGWPRNRTRYFFNKMFDAGIVERVAKPLRDCTSVSPIMISLLAMPVLKQPRGRRRQRRWLGWERTSASSGKSFMTSPSIPR